MALKGITNKTHPRKACIHAYSRSFAGRLFARDANTLIALKRWHVRAK